MEKIGSLKVLFIKKPININEEDNKRIALSDKNHMIKINLNTLLDIDIKVMLFLFHSLCVKLPQMNAYAKYFDKNSKCMNHLVKHEKIPKNI